jgi:hypothetical protein
LAKGKDSPQSYKSGCSGASGFTGSRAGNISSRTNGKGNQLRHERAGPKIAELDSGENLADVSIATPEDPHDLYVRNLQREQVRTAIQQLPIEFRIVLVP